MFWLRRSKCISLGRTWSKPKCFGRAGQDVSRLVEPVRNIEFRGRTDRNIYRLVKLGPNPDVLVAPVKMYLAWSKHRCSGRAGRNVSRLVELGRNLDVLVAPVKTYLAWSILVET